MIKKLFFSIIFSTILLLSLDVEAKVMSKDEIEDDSYIIGNYLFTRDKNTDNDYNGELTTQVMLLASKSINSDDLEGMKVYYKTFLGEWINGITGEEITPPDYFQIENRNLTDILPTPEMDCMFTIGGTYTADDGKKIERKSINCTSSVVLDNKIQYYSTDPTSSNTNIEKINGGVEFYVLKNADGTLPTSNAYFDASKGIFRLSGAIITPVKLDSFDYEYYIDEGETLYQIVSRFYYLDGEEKIYSEYSNIQTNGASAKFNLKFTSVKIDATINENYAVKVDSSYGLIGAGVNHEVNYYNVKFNLAGVDTSKYMIREYRVYSSIEAIDGTSNHYSEILNAEGASVTLETLYYDSLANEKYTKPRRLGGGTKDVYLIADMDGMNAIGGYLDMSSTQTFSKRLYWQEDENDDVSRQIVARATICTLDQSECYEIAPTLSSITGNNSFVRP